MLVICSYCRAQIGEKEPLDDDRHSHGICLECYNYYMPQIQGMNLDQFIDRFDLPVAIFDGNARVLAVNDTAAQFVGRPKAEIVGLLGGEVFECENARLVEGCGRTVHCAACAFRQTIQEASRTGTSVQGARAKITKDDQVLDLTISAEKMGDVVRVVVAGSD